MTTKGSLLKLTILCVLLLQFYSLSPQDANFNEEKVKSLEEALLRAPEEQKASLYNKLSREYWWNDRDFGKILEYGKKALELAQAQGNHHEEIIALANMGLAYRQLGDDKKALFYARQAARDMDTQFTPSRLMYTLEVLGEIYTAIHDYTEP